MTAGPLWDKLKEAPSASIALWSIEITLLLAVGLAYSYGQGVFKRFDASERKVESLVDSNRDLVQSMSDIVTYTTMIDPRNGQRVSAILGSLDEAKLYREHVRTSLARIELQLSELKTMIQQGRK